MKQALTILVYIAVAVIVIAVFVYYGIIGVAP